MTNPFVDFHPDHSGSVNTAKAPVGDTRGIQPALAEGYLACVAREAPHLAWVVDHRRVVDAYAAMVTAIDGLNYSAYDIETLADSLDSGTEAPILVPGPAGLYLSALVNNAAEKDITLRLNGHRHAFHFLGYRLGPDRTLTLAGTAGDFTGACLDGGTLVVKGSTGSWCGAGMLNGRIRVEGDAGSDTAQWMHGGEIQVDGQIEGIGAVRYGGRIHDGKNR